MFGSDGDIRGIIPRSVEYLFSSLAKKSSTNEVAMVCSFLEIYNDQVRDLGKAYLVAMGVESPNSVALYEKTSDIFENLAGKRGNPYFAPAFHRPGSAKAAGLENRPGLKEVQDEYNTMNYEIREDNEGNVFVKDLSLIPVTNIDEVISLINSGLRVRATHETKMNAVSSRSHTVFTITVLQRDKITGQAITGNLNLVDLAGSERLKKSESQGIRLKEALHINSSLTALGKVIMALDPSSETTHVPYRDSKLTRVLQNSLGGNSYTCVIAAIHPSAKYYEECLSTLQFANRCRNVRNNPKVNYVDENEDKDKRIKRLVEEVTSLKTKLAQSEGGNSNLAMGMMKSSAGNEISPNKIISLLKLIGINATISGDNQMTINGKKFSFEELGLTDNGLGEVSATLSASIDPMDGSSPPTRSGRSKSDANANQTIEKLQKQIKELKEVNETYSLRNKERKSQIDDQSRELLKLNQELIKCRTVIKHKEFEYNNLLEEKERSINDIKTLLNNKYQDEMNNVIQSNQILLKSSQQEMEKIPAAIKDYTVLFNKLEKQKIAVEIPLRKEFENYLNQINTNHAQEIVNIRKQYEYYLTEKDKALSGFVEAFNAYRNKKSEQLRMAEREIVHLYDYTEQIEIILDNVEKGKYQVKQKQGTKGGKSTTGVVAMGEDQATSGFGAIVLPKGIRPLNPLKINDLHGENLALTKRIVEKHKERVAKLDKMKEEAFQKSLHFAAQAGATATGNLDETLKQQVRDLLVAKSPRTGNGRSGSTPNTPSNLRRQKTERSIVESQDSDDEGLGTNQASRGSNARPSTFHGEQVSSRNQSFYNDAEVNDIQKLGHATAPGGLQGRLSSDQDIWVNNSVHSNNSNNSKNQPFLNEALMKELEELREKVKLDKVRKIILLYYLFFHNIFFFRLQLRKFLMICRITRL